MKIVLSKRDFLISNCSDLDAAVTFAADEISWDGCKLDRKVDKEDEINIVLRDESTMNSFGKSTLVNLLNKSS